MLIQLAACSTVPADGGPGERPQTTAQGQPVSSGSPTATAGDDAAMLESARRSVRSTTEWLARGVDSWFGDRPFSDGGKVTDGRLSLRLLTRQHENPTASVRFNARFRLPNLERRTYLFVGRDDDRQVVTDQPDASSREQLLQRENSADRAFFAGFGLELQEAIDLRVGFRGGLKPYAQARYRRPWQFGDADLLDFRETLFWSLDEHFGSTTALSYEHSFSPSLEGRWLNTVTLTERSRKPEWSSNLGAYQSYGDQRLLSLEALVFGVKGGPVAVTDYGMQVKWAQPVFRRWLIGEVVVGHFWPRDDPLSPRLRAWAVGGSVKMKF